MYLLYVGQESWEVEMSWKQDYELTGKCSDCVLLKIRNKSKTSVCALDILDRTGVDGRLVAVYRWELTRDCTMIRKRERNPLEIEVAGFSGGGREELWGFQGYKLKEEVMVTFKTLFVGEVISDLLQTCLDALSYIHGDALQAEKDWRKDDPKVLEV